MMKLIVLVVLSIAVFRASCRERPDGRDHDNDGLDLSIATAFPYDDDFSDGWNIYGGSNQPDGHKDEVSTLVPGASSPRPIDNYVFTNDDVNTSTFDMDPGHFIDRSENYDFTEQDRQIKEDGTVEKDNKIRGGSKCKSDIVCSLLGGACIANTIYCSGREVPSLCGGDKCKCCFTVNIEVKMHDIEAEFRSMAENITKANSRLNENLESMVNQMISAISNQTNVISSQSDTISNQSDVILNQSNVVSNQFEVISNQSTMVLNLDKKADSLKSANADMKKDLDIMMSNITNANAEQEIELKGIKKNQVNMEVKMHDIEAEFRSMAANITKANSRLNENLESMMNQMISAISNQSNVISSQSDAISNQSDVILSQFDMISNQSTMMLNLDKKTDSLKSANIDIKKDLGNMMSNINNANADLDAKLDDIRKNQGGFENMFLFLNDEKRNWQDSKAACKALGLDLARPYSPVAARNYIVKKYGESNVVWIDGRADGSNVKWQRTGEVIPKDNLWWPGLPGGHITTNHCLGLLAQQGWINQNPTRPLYSNGCNNAGYALCGL